MVRLVLGAPAFAIGFLTGLLVAGKPAARRRDDPKDLPVLIVPSLEAIGLRATDPAPSRTRRLAPGA